ncbi:MAG: DUF1338 domain-containing protein [Oligoflexales bacterium]|nr:DUF1338 domain-containing protein [Oligoflexales bacterium]
MTKIQSFFEKLWKIYTEKTPQAEKIKQHFLAKGEKVINDHVAFRTFAGDKIGISSLEPFFLQEGFQISRGYEFEEKKLIARSYQHSDPEIPKIFLSELLTTKFSSDFQNIVGELCKQVRPESLDSIDVFLKGCLWNKPSYEQYKILQKESEYGSWLAVNGFCANHFTLSANHLDQFDLLLVNEEVKSLGYKLNSVGGEVKGSKEVLLEQSSTMAHQQKYTFNDGKKEDVSTCFYEFIQRYPDKDGKLYQGFRTSNADKIFESTNLS